MNTKFYMNEHGTPVYEVEYMNGEKYYLMPFRKVNFQMSMNPDGFGSAGNSSNMYFSDIRKCMDIAMNHTDGYWVEEFPVETIRKIILSSAREALFDHFHSSYGAKHIDEIGSLIKESYGFDRKSPWHKFITECYKHFGVNTKWDE